VHMLAAWLAGWLAGWLAVCGYETWNGVWRSEMSLRLIQGRSQIFLVSHRSCS
jgi:hypothetical protein